MNDVPLGYRAPQHEVFYATGTSDPRITIDRVSPSVEGYFRIPAIWVGETPNPQSVLALSPRVHHEIVYERTLDSGVTVKVQRDGFFLFDFGRWPLAPQVVIPGYTAPAGGPPYRLPKATSEAEAQAESYAVIRAQVMNAHQACLTTAEQDIKRRGAMMGFPMTAWSTEKFLCFPLAPSYHVDSEDIHSLAKNVLNNSLGVPREKPIGRRMIELDVIDHSFTLLDVVLSDLTGQLTQIVELAFIASCRVREKRFGEAITLGWSVCEQLIFIMWKRVLDEKRARNSDEMSSSRIKKLMGRDLTASIVCENLELLGAIDHQLFKSLNVARQARNNWAHSLRVPEASHIHVCMTALEKMIHQVKGIKLSLQSGGRGGVPQWPLHMMDRARGEVGR